MEAFFYFLKLLDDPLRLTSVSEITKIMFTFNNINLGALKTIPEYDYDLPTVSPTWAPVYRRKRQDYDTIYKDESGLDYG